MEDMTLECDYTQDECSDGTLPYFNWFNFNDLKINIDFCASEVKAITVNPLEIPEVVENVMKYVGGNDLMDCREVCRLWNTEVVKILTNTPESLVELCDGSDCITTPYLKIGRTPLEEIKDIVDASKNPELLFKNVLITSLPPSNDPCPIDIPEIHAMLVKFGKYVKNLDIWDTSNDFRILKKCLAPGGYCPNVQNLDVLKRGCKDNPASSSMEFVKLEKLNLKSFGINHFYWNCENPQCIEIEVVLKEVLQNCSEIEFLTISDASPSKSIFKCVELLETVPELTKNLKSFFVEGNVFQNLKALCQIQFSAKLKMVGLIDKMGFTGVSKEKKKEDLENFLKLFGNSLDVFHVWDSDENPDNSLYVNDLPCMPSLKHLLFWTWGDEPYQRFDFLKNFPCLKVLKPKTMGNLHSFLEPYLEVNNQVVSVTPGSLNYLPKLVHNHLEEIELRDDEFAIVSSPSTIQILNSVFPNFKELHINLKVPGLDGYWVEGQRFWFERLFHAISEMKNLQTLGIGIVYWTYNEFYGIADLTQAFSFLKAAPNLETLLVRGYDAENPNYKFLMQHLLGLIGAPKLRYIELLDFPVDDMNEEIVEKFELNNVSVL